MKIVRVSSTIISLFILVLITGCSGLPDDAKKLAEEVPASIEKTSEKIQKKKSQFAVLQTSGDWTFFGKYAEKEKWQNYFADAQRYIVQAKEMYEKNVVPMVKKNSAKDATALFTHIGNVKKLLRKAEKAANNPFERKNFLAQARKDIPQLVVKAKENVAIIDELFSVAQQKTEKAKADAKKYGWAKSDKDFNETLGSLKIEADKAHELFGTVEAETKKGDAADVAQIADASREIENFVKSLQKKQPAFLKKTEELYNSYSKILEDMRVENYVKIVRFSWDDSSDWDTTKETVLISKQVTADVAEYFETKESIMFFVKGVFGNRVRFQSGVDQAHWDALGIDLEQNWPDRSHDVAEYVVEDVFSKTFHKYVIVRNDFKKTTDWIAVDEDFYWDNEQNLGMTIVSKPYGMYESETTKKATPVGMDYIAKPQVAADGTVTGSNRYGEWKRDPSTGSYFWSAFAGNMAAEMLFGGNHYYYNDWDTWNRGYRGRRSYYGDDERYGTYGYNTYRSGSRYNRGYYAKTHAGSVHEARTAKSSNRKSRATTRKTKSQRPSVRGAGPSNRGRGASGKGGK